MHHSNVPILTPRDFAILETLLAEHVEINDRLATAIRRKQEQCKVHYDGNLPKDVVTLGSRLSFKIDDHPQVERRLVEPQHYVPGQGCQSIATMRGIAMLGLSVGARVGVDLGSRVETLEILDLLYQPQSEAAARQVSSPQALPAWWPEPVISKPTTKPVFDDDPGPAAA